MLEQLCTARLIPEKRLHRRPPCNPSRCAIGAVVWALLELHSAGTSGCTPIDHPGPRWSAYVFKLKRLHSLVIETKNEAHKGPFAGTHARYVLHSRIEILERNDLAELARAA